MTITGTYEWAPCKYNCIKGCMNDCRYCYAKFNALRFKRATKDTWKHELPNPNALYAKKYKGRVMFPTSHDFHLKSLEYWGKHLDGLLKFGNDLLIVSKPEWGAMQFIIDRYRGTEFMNQMEFRFTIGTDDDEAREFWEPGAPSIPERLKCLKYAYDNGFRTSVSMEPLLMDDPVPFINEFQKHVTGEIWIGLMNHVNLKEVASIDPSWSDYQQTIQSRSNVARIYEMTKGRAKIRYKDSIRDLLGVEQNHE